MSKETVANISAKARSIVPSNVIYGDFAGRKSRIGIVPIAGIFTTSASIVEERGPNVIDFPSSKSAKNPDKPLLEKIRQKNAYSPRRLKEQVLDAKGRVIDRISKGSRCLRDRPHHPDRCKGKSHIRRDDPKEDDSPNQQNKLVGKGNNEKNGGSLSHRRSRHNSGRLRIQGRLSRIKTL